MKREATDPEGATRVTHNPLMRGFIESPHPLLHFTDIYDVFECLFLLGWIHVCILKLDEA